MSPPRPTQLLHQFLRESVRPGETVIDATCGNGHDTLLLAKLTGPSGKVIGTDIQQKAIDSTKARLESKLDFNNHSLHRICHSKIATLAAPDSISAVIFNLGYLPGADHDLITTARKTTEALRAAVSLLQSGGSIGVVCYTGHPGGTDEAIQVTSFFKNLRNHLTVRYDILGTLKPAPFLIFSTKKEIS